MKNTAEKQNEHRTGKIVTAVLLLVAAALAAGIFCSRRPGQQTDSDV